MEHCELVSEMTQVEHMTTGERLALARRRRTTQLKLWAAREREWERGRHRRERTNHRRIRFSDSVMLLEAASRNDITEVERLLEKGVSPDSTNEDGLTALHQCCIDDNEEMMKLLLQYGANVNAEDSEKWTPLHAAATCGHLHLVRYLIASGADLLAVNADGNMAYDICEDEAALEHIESEMARRGVTQQLIDETRALTETQMLADLTQAAAAGADLELHDDHGATPLHIAAANGYLRVVEFLLDQHVSTDVKDNDDWQPVHAAACWGHLEVVELLVHNGADLNARTKHDETPADICEDPELRERITELRTEQESKRQQEARRRVKRTQSNNTRTQSVRRTSIRDKTLTSKKDAVEEARLRRQAQEDAKTNPLTPIVQTPSEPKDDKIDPLATPIVQTPPQECSDVPVTADIEPHEEIEEVFKQPVDMPDVGVKLSPDLTLDTREGGGGGDWSEANGVLSLARREPEGKDSDSRLNSEDGKGSPLELPTEASYTTEGNGKINIHVSVTINAGTLAELKKQRAQNRNSSPDISVIQAQTSARSSVTGSEMENPSVKRFAGNTGDNVIGDTKVFNQNVNHRHTSS
ncbi:protein phosphatase 1 regulatory subunit 16A isoform X1 [Macrosteles quadrilineatus]|uniref:protein phosphatase 1 regulatory subunit 16A isoform X1 n=1 Tax=Macrosteles quadrilineatus TaxID=74068 RepID=UPI0023E0CF87|nr:protein phosphatase 1 regulatory subunit 16A isoform X1 [Macrosteles quadrilineatus]XP_054286675.1 protein phosphatase 1 regulatory subunit 16A isoform X1 [Macrosteles quadrilineatus]